MGWGQIGSDASRAERETTADYRTVYIHARVRVAVNLTAKA